MRSNLVAMMPEGLQTTKLMWTKCDDVIAAFIAHCRYIIATAGASPARHYDITLKPQVLGDGLGLRRNGTSIPIETLHRRDLDQATGKGKSGVEVVALLPFSQMGKSLPAGEEGDAQSTWTAVINAVRASDKARKPSTGRARPSSSRRGGRPGGEPPDD